MRRFPLRSREETDAFRREVRAVEPRTDAEVAFQLSRVHAFAGDRDEALRLLESAVSRHAFLAPFCAVDPVFDPVRDDPRFSAVLCALRLRT